MSKEVKRLCASVGVVAILFVCAVLCSKLIDVLLFLADKVVCGRAVVGGLLFCVLVWYVYRIFVSMGES